MVRFRYVIPTLFLALFAVQGTARADFTATADLLGSNERPTPHFVPGFGTASVVYEAGKDDLLYNVTFADLSAPATASHIHFGGPNVTGPVILPFTNMGPPAATSGTFSGTLTNADIINSATSGLTDIAQIAAQIEAGNTYVNIHTSTFPGGEIRGQLLVTAVPEPGSVALFLGMALTGAGFVLKKRRR